MATFVLIHGAADSGWFWHLVDPELRARGHHVVTMDLPCEDDSAGLVEYVDTVIHAIGDRKDLVVVAQSFGGFTAPLVCERVPVVLMVLVAAMVPLRAKQPATGSRTPVTSLRSWIAWSSLKSLVARTRKRSPHFFMTFRRIWRPKR
jgi:pimeloyl-ACP methyl ester carboxylesterase